MLTKNYFITLILMMIPLLVFSQQNEELEKIFLKHELMAEENQNYRYRSEKTSNDPEFYTINNKVAVLEYTSLYDVHTPPDTSNYNNLFEQYGEFDNQRILTDLKFYIHHESYQFVLLYSVSEVPGWINSGKRARTSAINIGRDNSTYNIMNDWVPDGWENLRSVPHMNTLDFINDQPYFNVPWDGKLVLLHEIGHHWLIFYKRGCEVTPVNWETSMPVAWLVHSCGHWNVPWKENQMPGIMHGYSTSNKFNYIDLYTLGLMGYEEVKNTTYEFYFSGSKTYYPVNIDTMITSLPFNGEEFFDGDGKRFPDTDPALDTLNVLLAIIKGADEVISEEMEADLLQLADELPGVWLTATENRSVMDLTLYFKNPSAISLSKDKIKDIQLYQNYPNPFNSVTSFCYNVPQEGRVKISVYNINGEKISEVFNGIVKAGYNNFTFNASGLSSGIYLYKMEYRKKIITKKMLCLK